MPDPNPTTDPRRLRLGHIAYSNCFPVHGRFFEAPRRADPALLEGTPATLNRMLASGLIDLSPSSSIEYALHADRYRILPDLVIGARGAVRSILLLSRVEPEALSGRVVAIPSASATSIVLLKILLRLRWRADVEFRWFDQACDDPFAQGAAAALFIGDVALRPDLHPDQQLRIDLGAVWWEMTGLPFAFALWQTASGEPQELRRVHELLLESRDRGRQQLDRLAQRYAPHFRFPTTFLHTYWSDLSFDLDREMLAGLHEFYSLAAEIGELAAVPTLRWIE